MSLVSSECSGETEVWRSYSECSFFEAAELCSGLRTNRRAVAPLPFHQCFLCFQIRFSETPYSGFWTDLLVPLNFICLPIQSVPQRQPFFQCFHGGHRISCHWPVVKLASFSLLKVAGEVTQCKLNPLYFSGYLASLLPGITFVTWLITVTSAALCILLHLHRWSPPWFLQSQNVSIFSVF